MESLNNYKKEERPWGDLERLTINEKSTVKILTLLPGGSLSLQTHQNRDEFWRVIKGGGTIHIGGNDLSATEGDHFFIPRYVEHRATGGASGFSLLEIAFGESDESDITRIADEYGRV